MAGGTFFKKKESSFKSWEPVPYQQTAAYHLGFKKVMVKEQRGNILIVNLLITTTNDYDSTFLFSRKLIYFDLFAEA